MVADPERHFISLLVAGAILFGVFRLTLGERPDTAVHTDLAFHIFELVE